MTRTVRVPEEHLEIFERAEALVSSYFGRKRETPETGRIEVGGQRYILVRAPSLSVEFYDLMESLYGGRIERAHEVARSLLFHLAHAIGRSDARAFQEELGLDDPMARLSAGPVHFAHCGWAFVDILPESRPTPDESYLLVYDHPYSFEAQSWISAGRTAPRPVCFMNAGYSSGWCEESFGIPLRAAEILCSARGDPCCRFIMAGPERIEAAVAGHLARHAGVAAKVSTYEVPGEFEHRDLAARLQLSETRYRHLFEASTDAILVVEDGRIDHGNRASTELLRLSRTALKGLPLVGLAPEVQSDGRSSAPLLERAVARAADGDPQQLSIALKAGEETIEVELSLSRIVAGSSTVLAVLRDVTERRRLAREVRQLQKMEALGTLAGGIAHDFNNLLTSIRGNLVLLDRTLLEGFEGREWLVDAQNSLDRASSMVGQLLTLTRRSRDVREVLGVEALVADAVRLLGETIDPRIALEVRHEDRAARLEGDEHELAGVLVNLVLNARDAVVDRLEGGGDGGEAYRPRIAIETSVEQPVHGLETEPDVDRPARLVRISVSDNGAGMQPEAARRCFEPFFTTKPVGRGTGLGLTTAFGIVQGHGGRIALETAPGQGTRFSIELPESHREMPPRRARAEREEPPRGSETVLFADDEAPLRKLVTYVFERLGYRVVLASDGAEALRILEAPRAVPIDVVVLDLTMPRFSGREVLERIRRSRPSLPVVLSSGYSTELHSSELLARGASAFVAKPYDIDDLARVVRRILDEERPPE